MSEAEKDLIKSDPEEEAIRQKEEEEFAFQDSTAPRNEMDKYLTKGRGRPSGGISKLKFSKF